MPKRSWIVGALAMLLGCSMAAYGAMSVGTLRRPEPKVVMIAEELEISGYYYSDPIDAVGYDAISISAEWGGSNGMGIMVFGRNSPSENFRPIRTHLFGDYYLFVGGAYPDSGYFTANQEDRDMSGLRCPQIQVRLSGEGTANVSIYME